MASTSFQPALVLPTPLNPAAKRVEIDEFIVDNVMTNLFLLALREMHDEKIKKASDPAEDWFSYYDVSAIHGYPDEYWRDVKNKPPQESGNGFYCTHGSTVFPTWHRLSMHMFEQAVFRKMQKKANEFTDQKGKQHYLDALKRFRLPYWDPVMPRFNMAQGTELKKMFGMPEILSRSEVWVMDPQKDKTSIANPLHHFKFPEQSDYTSTGRKTINWAQDTDILPPGRVNTVRTPDQKGNTDDAMLQDKIQRQYQGLSNALYYLLNPGKGGPDNRARTWEAFANHFVNKVNSAQGFQPPSVSLESWHDQIHGLVGSGRSAGHMNDPAVASFDPVFWLHHNNVDRLFALYQALYEEEPDKFVAAQTTAPNRVNASSDMAPFAKSDGPGQPCYNSNDVKDWTACGFASPGNKKLDAKGKDDLARLIRDTYLWSSERARPPKSLTYPRVLDTVFALKGQKFDIQPSAPVQFVAMEHSTAVKKVFPQDGSTPTETPVDLTFKDDTQDKDLFPLGSFVDRNKGEMRTWTALLNVKKYAFHQSFTIELFIGKNRIPPSDEAWHYYAAPNEAGFSSIFAFDPTRECDNCAHNADMIYGDAIPLTDALTRCLRQNSTDPAAWPPADLRVLEDLEPPAVVPFLTEQLEWRVVDPKGAVKSEGEVASAGLELVVADRTFVYPKEGNNVSPLGDYGPYTLHPEVTRGKVGGARA